MMARRKNYGLAEDAKKWVDRMKTGQPAPVVPKPKSTPKDQIPAGQVITTLNRYRSVGSSSKARHKSRVAAGRKRRGK